MSSPESNIFPRGNSKPESQAASRAQTHGIPQQFPSHLPPMMPGAPGVHPERIPKPGATGYIRDEAYKLVVGLTTHEEIKAKYGPRDFEAIMEETKNIDRDTTPESEFYRQFQGPMKRIPEVLRAYWGRNKTESSTEAFDDLFEEVQKDPRFVSLYESYRAIIAKRIQDKTWHEGELELFQTNALRTYYENYYKPDKVRG